eukprot:95994_1
MKQRKSKTPPKRGTTIPTTNKGGVTKRNAARSSSPLRVCIYLSSFFVTDGVTITLRDVVRHLTEKEGGEVMVITADAPSCASIEEYQNLPAHKGKVKVHVFPGGKIPKDDIMYYIGLSLREDTKRAIEEFKPTVLHIANPDPHAGMLVNWMNRDHPDVAIVATLHSHYVELVSFYNFALLESFLKRVVIWGMRQMYDLIPATYVPSQDAKDKYMNYGWKTNLRIWGRGVDDEELNPSRRSSDWRTKHGGLEDSDICILWVGRLVPEKRPVLWAECVQAVADELSQENDHRRVHGVCVGDGPDWLLKEIKGNRPAIECIGFKSGPELAEAFASGDIFLFPSEVETFGRVTLEACASGKPCIVDKGCGGHLVTDGVNGFTVPTGGGLDDYLGPLRRLVKDDELRKDYGDGARLVALGYTKVGMQEAIVKIYRENLLEQKGMVRKSWYPAATFIIGYIWQIVYFVLEFALVATQFKDSVFDQVTSNKNGGGKQPPVPFQYMVGGIVMLFGSLTWYNLTKL